MRVRLGIAFVASVTLLGASPVRAQDGSDRHPYHLDPYKPSEAWLLRSYGATLVSQTPLSELRQLDPYKPSHAALLRLGGALPLWAVWFEWPLVARPAAAHVFEPADDREKRRHRPADAPGAIDDRVEMPVTSTPPAPTAIATLRRPESNDGVWIEFDGRRWIADGRAVPFVEGRFTRVGERGGHPVYRETAGASERIFIATADDLVAPFRPR
jgi:hypothetical protein